MPKRLKNIVSDFDDCDDIDERKRKKGASEDVENEENEQCLETNGILRQHLQKGNMNMNRGESNENAFSALSEDNEADEKFEGNSIVKSELLFEDHPLVKCEAEPWEFNTVKEELDDDMTLDESEVLPKNTQLSNASNCQAFDMDEQLIELVRERPELYDMGSSRYSDNTHKSLVWEDIGNKLNKSAYECKQRWMSLRSKYRRILLKRKGKNGQTGTVVEKWRLEEHMEFLTSFTRDKTRFSSSQCSDILKDDKKLCSEDVQDETGSTIVTNTPSSSLETNSKCDETPAAKQKKILNPKPNETASATLMRYILDEKIKEEKLSQDPVELFFKGIAATVKSFTPNDQHQIKKQIYFLVSDMEEKYINWNQERTTH
ncbi:uncharacterized protein [Periplaneta americana]|uniref:uncharacterized protein isoform X2 n=1 Tax=Periplaneta americana TaxID=6978 RepID=UPI0037E90FBB